MLGQRVHNFRIVRLLGQGGMGSVYEAEHLLIKRKVAVKLLKPELAATPEMVQRFVNEARATSAIRHPNIVEVLDVGRLRNGGPYLVMELLEGESLAARLERVNQLPVSEAIELARQAASGIEAAHRSGIVHRDLKPDNLFLVRDQRDAGREIIKVLDFGIAKLRGDPSAQQVTTMAGELFGTPGYMSPEQCRGVPGEVDHRTDIYALGVILYEALCGRLPFEAEGFGDMMMQHMTELPEPPRTLRGDVPERLERAVLTALAKRREDRFASMGELELELAAISTSDLESVAHAPPATRAQARTSDEDPSVTAVTTRLEPKQTPPAAVLASHADADADADAPRPRRTPLLLGAAVALLAAAGALVVLRPGPHGAPPPSTAGDAQRASPPSPVLEPAPSAVPAAAAGSASATSQGAPTERQATSPESAVHAATLRSTRRSAKRGAAARVEPAASEAKAPTTLDVAGAPAVAAKLAPSSAQADAQLAAQPALANGYLSLDSAPWSNVLLGGKLLGTTPLVRVPLPPGKYVLTLQNPELGKSTSYVVEIESGTNLKRMVGLE